VRSFRGGRAIPSRNLGLVPLFGIIYTATRAVVADLSKKVVGVCGSPAPTALSARDYVLGPYLGTREEPGTSVNV
jgi:hypothetical protein